MGGFIYKQLNEWFFAQSATSCVIVTVFRSIVEAGWEEQTPAYIVFQVMTPGRTTRMERSSVIGAGLGSGASTSGEERKKPGETIHSGQFMVSHFETEGQEDEDDDDLGMQVVVEDVKPAIVDTVISNIISKRNPELSMETANLIASSSNAIVPLRSGTTGMELIKYAQKRQPLQLTSRHTSSQVEIDTDLSTVFNTLNVTYT